jgi:plasmid stabilization system protein ParE
MTVIRWTEPANADFLGIAEWLNARNPMAAARVGRRILDTVEMLDDHPYPGKPAHSPDTRELAAAPASCWQRQIGRRAQNAHAAPWVEHNQIVIAADDKRRTRRQSEFQVFVILRVSAVGDAFGRDEPRRHATDHVQNLLATFTRQHAGEFRAVEHLRDFVMDLSRESKNIRCLRAKQGSFRHAIGFEHRADDGRCVENDQVPI